MNFIKNVLHFPLCLTLWIKSNIQSNNSDKMKTEIFIIPIHGVMSIRNVENSVTENKVLLHNVVSKQ